MNAPEMNRPIKVRALPPAVIEIVASAEERAALAKRFDILAVKTLAATLNVESRGDAVLVTGRMSAAIVQECAVSGDDIERTVEEDISLRFVPARHRLDRSGVRQK